MDETTLAKLDELVEGFASQQIAQDECVSRGDSAAGNRHAAKLIECFDELAVFGDLGRDALSRLLEHENPSVRCTTAAFLLRYKHEDSMSVLEELAARPELGMVALGAKCSIENWINGEWALDPEDDAE